jgi:S-adenosylmethionine hydrolase
MSPRVITLLTDFGLSDPYVGMMKGVILSINPSAVIVDLTHDVPAHDVRTGSFLLERTVPYFPKATIHIAVVDPGVGTARPALAIRTKDFILLGPDNGILSLAARKGQVEEIIRLTAREYFLPEVSSTFHGRDIFAPAAAHCSAGVPLSSLGEPVHRFETLRRVSPSRRGKALRATVLLVDRFGNCITNIERSHLDDSMPFSMKVGSHKIDRLCFSYGDGPEDAPLALWGSYDLLEIAWKEDSAAQRLGLRPGAAILIELP